MPRRNLVFANNEYYHIYNRSVGKDSIFSSKIALRRVLNRAEYYRFNQRLRLSQFEDLPQESKRNYLESIKNDSPLVEIFAYAFMPNHYHFLLRQQQDKGIVRFISNTQNSFSKHFNTKYSRHGALFCNPFKARRIETDEEFIHVSRYIHLNPVTSYITEFDRLAQYPWTSFTTYMNGEVRSSLSLSTQLILNWFKSKERYAKFVSDQVDYQRKLRSIKHLLFD